MDSLEHKKALVTGAGSGIGLGVARALAKAGAAVALADLRPEAAEEGAAAIRAAGGQAIAIEGDMSDPEAIASAVQTADGQLGGVDILVNNAGLQYVAPIEQFPLEMWQKLLAVMLTGPFLATKAVIPLMKAKGWGRIINISSVHGKVASAFKSAYCSAKHGVVGLTRVAAMELASGGITVNAICPGYVDTPLVRKQLASLAQSHGLPESEVLEKVVLAQVPQKRLLEVSEVADLTVYLASDRAAGITGQAINISGGWVMH